MATYGATLKADELENDKLEQFDYISPPGHPIPFHMWQGTSWETRTDSSRHQDWISTRSTLTPATEGLCFKSGIQYVILLCVNPLTSFSGSSAAPSKRPDSFAKILPADWIRVKEIIISICAPCYKILNSRNNPIFSSQLFGRLYSHFNCSFPLGSTTSFAVEWGVTLANVKLTSYEFRQPDVRELENKSHYSGEVIRGSS